MLVMVLVMLLFWGAIIFGVIWLIRGGVRGGSANRETYVDRESPLEILERRFAEGALTLDDYKARREVLVNGRTAEPVAGRGGEPSRTRGLSPAVRAAGVDRNTGPDAC